MAATGLPALPGCRATTRLVCSFIKAFPFPFLPKAGFAPLTLLRLAVRIAAQQPRTAVRTDVAALIQQQARVMSIVRDSLGNYSGSRQGAAFTGAKEWASLVRQGARSYASPIPPPDELLPTSTQATLSRFRLLRFGSPRD